VTSNIEPFARAIAERICRSNGMPETKIPGWVDLHWQCAAAMLEAGVMDESGEWIANKNLLLGIEAYRERVRVASMERSATTSEHLAKIPRIPAREDQGCFEAKPTEPKSATIVRQPRKAWPSPRRRLHPAGAMQAASKRKVEGCEAGGEPRRCRSASFCFRQRSIRLTLAFTGTWVGGSTVSTSPTATKSWAAMSG